MILNADARHIPLADKSVQCCVTSPPYWGLRDYGHSGQIGLEQTPDEYVAQMVAVFREVWRVLRDDGTLWLNLGDSYVANTTGNLGEKITLGGGRSNQAANFGRPDKIGFGLPPKNLVGIPWRVAFALQADGWYLRQDIIWHKPNPMPESVTDRCTKAHEYVFLLAKSGKSTIWRARDTGEWSDSPDLTQRIPWPTADDADATTSRWRGHDYYYDADAVKEAVSNTPGAQAWRRTFDPSKQRKELDMKGQGVKGGNDGQRNPYAETRNRRSVWTVATRPYKGAHFATFPPKLIEPCILAGCPVGGTVLDPFGGSGTTGMVAAKHGRKAVLLELNPAYLPLAQERTKGVQTTLVSA